MSRNKLRIGMIEVGYVVSNNFLSVLPGSDDAKLAGITANHPEGVKEAQRLCNAQQVVQPLEGLVKLDLDCVSVFTLEACHAKQIPFLPKAGIDAYSEESMATTLKDADHMAGLPEQAGCKLMVGSNRRCASVCQKAKEVYTDVLSDVVIGQENRSATEYHTTLESITHIVDLMRSYGSEVKEIHVISKFIDPGYESLTAVQLLLGSGALGMSIADHGSGRWEENIEIYDGNCSVFIKMPDSITIVDVEEQHNTEMTPLTMGQARSEDKLGLNYTIRHFLDYVKEDRVSLTNAVDAYKIHELLDGILRSVGLPGIEQR